MTVTPFDAARTAAPPCTPGLRARELRADVLVSFVTVAERGSFAAAARALFLSPSCLTRQVAELERLLGQPLFVRRPGQLALTTEGRTLLPRAHSALAALDTLLDPPSEQQAVAG